MKSKVSIPLAEEPHPSEMEVPKGLGISFPRGALVRHGPFDYSVELNPDDPEHLRLFEKLQDQPFLLLDQADGELRNLNERYEAALHLIPALKKAGRDLEETRVQEAEALKRLEAAQEAESGNLDEAKFEGLRQAVKAARNELEDRTAKTKLYERQVAALRREIAQARIEAQAKFETQLRAAIAREAKVFNEAITAAYERWWKHGQPQVAQLPGQPNGDLISHAGLGWLQVSKLSRLRLVPQVVIGAEGFVRTTLEERR